MRHLMNKNKFRIIGAAAALIFGATSATAAPMDYNGGGSSDLAAVYVTRGKVKNGEASGSTRWVVRETEFGAFTEANFNVPGDALVPARWYGGNRTYPALVFVRSAKKSLEWHVKNPFGGTDVFSFGSPGASIPPNIDDVDGDGRADAVVTYTDNGAGLRRWEVFSTKFGTKVTDYFGQNTDQSMLADIDNDGIEELISFRPGFYWYAKKLGQPSFTTVQWGLTGDYPILPYFINTDNSADYVIARVNGANQDFYIRYSDNSQQVIQGGDNDAIPMVGNFGGLRRFAWIKRSTGLAAIRFEDGSNHVFPFGTSGAAIITTDGRVIQPSETGRFGTPPTTGGGGSSGGGGSFADVTCTKTYSDFGGRGGHTYRPNAGKGTKIILDSDFTYSFYSEQSEFRFYTTDGTFLGKSGYYRSLESGGRVRSYLNPHARNVPDKATIVAISGNLNSDGEKDVLCFINIDAKRSQN